MGLLPPRFVRRPVFRPIQTIGNRQARRVIGDRQRHRDLTIVAVLPKTTHCPRNARPRWQTPFLAKPVWSTMPTFEYFALRFDRRQDELRAPTQHRLVGPSRLAQPDEAANDVWPREQPAPQLMPGCPARRSCARPAWNSTYRGHSLNPSTYDPLNPGPDAPE